MLTCVYIVFLDRRCVSSSILSGVEKHIFTHRARTGTRGNVSLLLLLIRTKAKVTGVSVFDTICVYYAVRLVLAEQKAK